MAVITLGALLAAASAAAEVMDKEPTVGAIWGSVLVAVGIACVAAALQRWLLLASFLAFVPSAAAFAWTECHNAVVGPAIVIEAGSGYPLVADTAVSVVVAAHVGLWFAVSAWRRGRRRARAAVPPSHLRSLAYTVALLLLLAMTAAGGFGAEPEIVWSAPFVVGVASVLGAAALCWVGRSRPPHQVAA